MRQEGVSGEPLVIVQVNIPLWALVHLPVVVTITTAAFTPKVRGSLIQRPTPASAAVTLLLMTKLSL